MKHKLAIFGIILIFLAGVGVISYPVVSSLVNNLISRSQVEEYAVTTKKLSSESYTKLMESAKKYNDSLTNNVIITDPFDWEAYEKIGKDYRESLDVDGQGLIGYIDIPKINVYLPIYHGTDSKVLAMGAGHLQNTSLPIGGESTHSVISAHSAYPSGTLFDYLPDMGLGDEFYVHVLDRTLKYEVDQIKVVLPEEVDDMRVIRGEDHVTLLTCTPFSINTHRLLVRGKRVEYDDTEYITTGTSLAEFTDDYIYFLGYKVSYLAAGISIGVFVLSVILIVMIAIRRSKAKAKKSEAEDKPNYGDGYKTDGG